MLHVVIMSFKLFSSTKVSQSLPVSDDPDVFEEYWSGVLLTVPQFGFV